MLRCTFTNEFNVKEETQGFIILLVANHAQNDKVLLNSSQFIMLRVVVHM